MSPTKKKKEREREREREKVNIYTLNRYPRMDNILVGCVGFQIGEYCSTLIALRKGGFGPKG